MHNLITYPMSKIKAPVRKNRTMSLNIEIFVYSNLRMVETLPTEEATSPYFQRKIILLLPFSLSQFCFFLFPILFPASAWGAICGATGSN